MASYATLAAFLMSFLLARLLRREVSNFLHSYSNANKLRSHLLLNHTFEWFEYESSLAYNVNG